MQSIGERIKQRRKELKWGQADLARKIGMSQSTLSKLEANPTTRTREVAKIAALLGVSALWLAEGTGACIPDGTAPVIQNEFPDNILRLAAKLALLPDEKLRAVSVLLGIKF